jgi:hypothetical protein
MSADVVPTIDCDVLVVGSGAGGLATAVAAGALGLKVLVVEKDKYIGGTTALSGGFVWVPNNPVSISDGVSDSRAAARAYIAAEAGDHFDPSIVDAFLDHGPEAIAFFQNQTDVTFEPSSAFPDYHLDQPGALTGGRTIKVLPFSAKALGSELRRLRPPLAELSVAGLQAGSGPESMHFSNAGRSLRSALYVGRRILSHFCDIALYGRAMELNKGNAIAARLLRSALLRGVKIQTDCPARRLLVENGLAVGAVVGFPGRETRVRTRGGVVLATGGFPRDLTRRRELIAKSADDQDLYSLAPSTNTGDGIRMAEEVGAGLNLTYSNAAAWVPVSRVPRGHGSLGNYPHFIDRAKPGLIAVLSSGKRFVNEADSYHDFCEALLDMDRHNASPRAYLIADKAFVNQYGLGFAKPFPVPTSIYVRSGYLKIGRSLSELARACGIDPAALTETVAEWNRDVAGGADRAFGKGASAYNRFNGDPEHKPNACLGPITKPPFYAVEVGVGDLGTFAGVRTDGSARVLDTNGDVIPGLFAVGNDMASLMGGSYPGAGITLGPALVFGYVAAKSLAETLPSFSEATRRPPGEVPADGRWGLGEPQAARVPDSANSKATSGIVRSQVGEEP